MQQSARPKTCWRCLSAASTVSLLRLLPLALLISDCFAVATSETRFNARTHFPRSVYKRRDDSDNLPLKISNYCQEPIWPAIVTQAGEGPEVTGWKLDPGDSLNQPVSADWQGRAWGRANCSFNADGTGPAESNAGGRACKSGDCNGQLNCVVTGEVPVTLAEFAYAASDGHCYYDISLVDGYNLPMAIVMLPGANGSFSDVPPNLTNPSCIATSSDLAPPGYNPYAEGQATYLRTNITYRMPFEQSVNYSEVLRWCPWDLQQNPPAKPGDGVYPYPDDDIQRPIFNPCFSACAKNNKQQDCCTGEYNARDKCPPNVYAKAAKKVCPDAYSYAFDDQMSTFITPAGAGFEVIFCPGVRSSNILATYEAQLQELVQTGKVSNFGSESDTMEWQAGAVSTRWNSQSQWLASLIAFIVVAMLNALL